MAEVQGKRPHVLFFSYPRNTVNLLLKTLNLENQPGVLTGPFMHGYDFLPIGMHYKDEDIWDKPTSEWTEEQKAQTRAVLQQCFQTFDKLRQDADADGNMVFTKEHIVGLLEPEIFNAYFTKEPKLKGSLIQLDTVGSTRSEGNSTVFSDEYLALWRPLFLLRHPIRAFPSQLRVTQYGFGKNLKDAPRGGNFKMYHFFRGLYDLYCTFPDRHPIVLDADDYLEDPSLLEQLAKETQLDPSKVQLSWEPVPAEMQAQSPVRSITQTLMDSSGIEVDKVSRGLTMEGQMPKWVAEFGEEQAMLLGQHIQQAIPDYEYLLAKRMKP